jgi:hypothetical protein
MNWIEHVCEPQRLILAWQAPDSTGERFRWAVGEVAPGGGGALTLRYFVGDEFERANQGKSFDALARLGYLGYPGFRTKDPLHKDGVLEAFMRRVLPSSRTDFAEYRAHFRLKPDSEVSDLGMLGYTEAKLPSDGFSLVNPLEGPGDRFELMTEVAGFRYYAAANPPVAVGDLVTFKPEPTNEHDANAVMVCVAGRRIGNVNRLQAPAFRSWLNHRSIEAVIERVNGSRERPRVYVFVRVMPSQGLAAA